MGNCQAIDAAALVIQHPSGSIERLYWPVTASEVMRLNPGHYVSLIIPLPGSGAEEKNSQVQEPKTVQFTRVKLLRPSDTLALGHAYRLVTTQEVMKVLRAKKYAKAKRQNPETDEPERQRSDYQAGKQRPRTVPADPAAAAGRYKSWRPSLQSIIEASG